MDAPRIQRGSTVLIPATLQGPAWTSIPDLQIISDIPLEIDFYNESDEILTKGSVAVCFGCVCFKDQSPAILKLSVRASRLSPYVFSTIPVPYPAYPDPFFPLPKAARATLFSIPTSTLYLR
jgi:hypothetical protein